MPPDQTQAPAPQQQAQPQAQGTPQSTAPGTAIDSVPHPPSEQQRWLQMVMAPFENIGQNAHGGDQRQIYSKQARVGLRSALHEGRWGGRHKLAQALGPGCDCRESDTDITRA